MLKLKKKLLSFLMATVVAVSFSMSAVAEESEAVDVGLDHICTEDHDHDTYVTNVFTEVSTSDAMISAASSCTHSQTKTSTIYTGGKTEYHPVYSAPGIIVNTCTARYDSYSVSTVCIMCGSSLGSYSFTETTHSICYNYNY